MTKSAGIIPYKFSDNGDMLFFLGHPGGMTDPYYAYLKGEVIDGEDDVDAAIREFGEESGLDVSEWKDRLVYLGEVQQNRKKTVVAYGVHVDDIDPDKCFSNMADHCNWPEIDRYRWMGIDEVVEFSHKSHIPFYKKLLEICG